MVEIEAVFTPGSPFACLRSADRDALLGAGKLRSFRKGEYLFRSGDPVEGVFCVATGAVRITQPQGGREVAVRLAGPGDWVGHRSIFTSELYRGSAQAKEKTKAFLAPSPILLKLFAANPDFAYQLIRVIARDLENAEKLLREQQELNLPTRLIGLFRLLDEKFGAASEGGRLLGTKISKVEIAQMLGASEEAVSRQLSKWKRERLLAESGKRFFLSRKLLGKITRV